MSRIEEIEARKAEIKAECEVEGADLSALEEEVRNLNAEIETIKAEAEKRQAIRDAVASGSGSVIADIKNEERSNMENIEIRNTKAYINAYANYIKNGDDSECRALLSTNGTAGSLTGYVPVPELVEGLVRTAWTRSGIMDRVRKTYLKGNVKVGFELSASGAVVHTEGAAAPDEETLTLGIVSMVPASIKKWISVSDEALDLSGEEFLRYIYDELTYRIAQKAEGVLIDAIKVLPSTATSTSVSASVVTAAPAQDTVAQAIGGVIGSNLAVMMNRGTWAAFKAAQYDGNFNADPFEGLPVLFTEALPAYSSASASAVYAIVGDLYEGAQANFPNGEEITIKVDNLSLAEKDLVKFVGREYVAIAPVADKRFALIKKPSTI